jgi:ABC-type transport system involved in multi-copper enzyme maturation permease subunit
MIRTLLLRSWRKHLRIIWGWVGFCALMCLYNYSLYVYLTHNPEYIRYLTDLPNWIRFFIGQPGQTISAANFLLLTTFNFTLPLVWSILTVYLAVADIAGEEEDGTLEFILIHPIRRWKLFLIKSFALIGTIVVMGVFFWGSLTLTVKSVSMPIGQDWIAWRTLGIGLFEIFSVGIAMMVGASRGRMDLAALITGLLLILLWALEGLMRVGILPPIVQWLNPYSMVLVDAEGKRALTPLVGGIMAILIIVVFLTGSFIWQRRSFWDNERGSHPGG